MAEHARGTFEVKLDPQGPVDAAGGTNLGRMAIDKRFLGDLEGTSRGEMLFARTEIEGSAGYVAIERVTGTLLGREGSFVLLHRGIMAAGEHRLSIAVVPDSGSGDLVGLIGEMTIEITDGKHVYAFDHAIPGREAPDS